MKGKRRSAEKHPGMVTVHPNAAAIDVGATMHMAAVGADCTSDPVRSFGTFTGDFHRLADWFAECGVKTVVMESTGVYWIPIFELLDERGVEVFLVNARDAKHVPGRKTDVSDAQWLQRRSACHRQIPFADIRHTAPRLAQVRTDALRDNSRSEPSR